MKITKRERLLALIAKHPGLNGKELMNVGCTMRWCGSLLKAEDDGAIIWSMVEVDGKPSDKFGWFINE